MHIIHLSEVTDSALAMNFRGALDYVEEISFARKSCILTLYTYYIALLSG